MRITLDGGFYKARSQISSAQRCINLYPELNTQASDAQTPVTHYPTPGLTLLATAPGSTGIRGAYTTTLGQLFVAQGNTLYFVSPTWSFKAVGTIADGSTPVVMQDNGQDLIVVVGSSAGYRVTLPSLAFSIISDDGWFGGTRIDFADGFFIANQPNTQQFFISDAFAATFSTSAFASKEGYPDLLATLIVMHREIWLLGQKTSEVYYNVGGTTFPYQIMPGVFIEHGCVAPYSVAKNDLQIFWLGQDMQGQGIVFRGAEYQAQRISTHAIEEEFATYPTLADAIGFTYQQEGHPFYVLTFPTADRTWVYDVVANLWHERAWMDTYGQLHRIRANCQTFYGGMNVVGDWQNGNLYQLDPNNFTDNGLPIWRVRSFPTVNQEDHRIQYSRFTADMQVGVGLVSGIWKNPIVNLRWSDDGGHTWGNRVPLALGAIGQFKKRAFLINAGIGRQRVFELSWSAPVDTALQGAWVTPKVLGS